MKTEIDTVMLDEVLGELEGARIRHKGARRIRVDIEADALPTLLQLLKGKAGYLHLSAISCVDWPDSDEFELIYHLWSYETRILVSAHTRIGRQGGRYISVYDLFVPAGFFERDIYEMYGL